MAGALRKFMVDFGLADDGLAELEGNEQSGQPVYVAAPQPIAQPREAYADSATSVVRPIQSAPGYQAAEALTDLRRITTIHPRSYNDARLIGEAFRAGTPVIMNLSDMSDDDAKRLVDFSAGLIFGLFGGIERVTSKVWLLSPEHIEVIGKEEIETTESNGGQFYNQS